MKWRNIYCLEWTLINILKVDASKARKAAPIERLAMDVMACYGIGNGERKTEVYTTIYLLFLIVK